MTMPSSFAPTTHARILSLNIASAFRDESICPLHARLPRLLDFLSLHRAEYDVLCLQEVRRTCDLSHLEVLGAIAKSTAMDFTYHAVNLRHPNGNPFYRATLYDPQRWVLVESRNTYCKFTGDEREDGTPAAMETYSVLSTTFDSLPDQDSAELHVHNVHAPNPRDKRLEYWERLMDFLWDDTRKNPQAVVVAVGDLNKMPEDRERYDGLLQDNWLTDLVQKDVLTFRSFRHDVDKDGRLFQSSLDGVVMAQCDAEKEDAVTARVLPTYDSEEQEDLKRPCDHFGVLCAIRLDNSEEELQEEE
jgi:endonuclease/exonuclease/phosphatase family metal-dependent hydrolase